MTAGRLPSPAAWPGCSKRWVHVQRGKQKSSHDCVLSMQECLYASMQCTSISSHMHDMRLISGLWGTFIDDTLHFFLAAEVMPWVA